MEKETKKLWTTKFKDMTPEEKKLMRKKIIKIFILAFILMIVIVAILPKDNSIKSSNIVTEKQKEQTELTKEQQKIRNDYIAGMKYLYAELQKIKTNPEFLQYGFAQKIGKEWYEQYKQFDSVKEFKGMDFMAQIIPDIDVLPGDLEILAQAYFSKNPDKKYIANTEKRFQNLLDNY